MPQRLRDFYDVLGVDRHVGEDDLRKAYRRQALELHPDKNPEQGDEATQRFQTLQHAYTVLSNPHERAWYDAHKEQILRGDDPQERGSDDDEEAEAKATDVNLYKLFSGSAYTGFGDDERGFFSVVRALFDELNEEEIARNDTDDQIADAPSFGSSTSAWTDTRRFYAAWKNFSSRRSFAFANKWRLSEADSREVRRLMERENSRCRQRARKAFNESVREATEFVYKRDPRVKEYHVEQQRQAELKEAKEKANKAVREEMSEQLRREREAQREVDLAYVDDMIEEMGLNENGGEEQQDTTDYYCAACKKHFQSKAQWHNHEKSKKHRERIERLRRDLAADEGELDQISGGSNRAVKDRGIEADGIIEEETLGDVDGQSADFEGVDGDVLVEDDEVHDPSNGSEARPDYVFDDGDRDDEGAESEEVDGDEALGRVPSKQSKRQKKAARQRQRTLQRFRRDSDGSEKADAEERADGPSSVREEPSAESRENEGSAPSNEKQTSFTVPARAQAFSGRSFAHDLNADLAKKKKKKGGKGRRA